MFPRYQKTKYTLKTPKEKIPYEKKALVRCIVSAGLVSLGIILSFFEFCPHQKIKYALNKTYALREWTSLAKKGIYAVKTGSYNAVSSYTALVKKAEKSLGIEDEPKINPSVKAKETKEPKKDQSPRENDIQQTEEVFMWTKPVKNGRLSSPFGEREHPITKNDNLHTGVDIAADRGDTVVAAYPGHITATGYDNANGYYAVADHGDGITTVYAHLDSVCVTEGEYVSPLIKVGEVGSTGISTGPHLHFEIKIDGKSVNPEQYVDF